jgi:hypothetical protein
MVKDLELTALMENALEAMEEMEVEAKGMVETEVFKISDK